MSEFIEFTVKDAKRFERLRCVFAALKHDKDAGDFRPDEEWPSLFDEQALDGFHWPPPGEGARWLDDLARRPVRITPTEETPGLQWDFFSMIDAFRNGEYELLVCRPVGEGKARLESYALAYPYGGVGCMVALVEAFGFEVTGIEDGTGFRKLR